VAYYLELQLNVDSSAGDFGEIAYRWFDEVSQALIPQERAEIAGLPARMAPIGKPGTVHGTVGIHHFEAGTVRQRRGQRNASAAGMRWLREQLRQPTRHSDLLFGRHNENGERTGSLARLVAETLPDSPDWLRLAATVAESKFLDPDHGAEVQRRYLDAAWPFADQLNPGFGHLAYSIRGGSTAFEYCLRNIVNRTPPEWWDHWLTVNHCREFLRGYSWLTIMPEELAARLGGADALAATGAFHQVRPLARGGVWLLATPDYRDFTDEALLRVFTVVAPVLRPGPLTDWPRNHGQPPNRVIFQDAAEATAS
jgi:hypothetical protein